MYNQLEFRGKKKLGTADLKYILDNDKSSFMFHLDKTKL